MINISSENFKKLKKIIHTSDMEAFAISLRKAFSNDNDFFSIFDTIRSLDTMVILFDEGEKKATRYISLKDSTEKNYLVLSANRTLEEMRFDAACMLRKIAKSIENADHNVAPTLTTGDRDFSREDKHFACALLMPQKELMKFITSKDESGNYLYLSENNEISLKNIHAVADHFGMPFNQCSSRIYHVFETLRKENKGVFYIEGCHTKKEYKIKKDDYTQEQRNKDIQEVCPNYKKNQVRRLNHLLNSLHYRSWSKLSEIAKRKLLVTLVKSDSVNEGVVKDEAEAKAIINNYIASGGKIYDGCLVTKDGEIPVSDEQLVVLGEFDLYTKTLERGLIKSIAKSNPDLKHLLKMDYKDAINSLTERDITNYIRDLHRRLFSNLSYKYGEERGGFYRSGSVHLKGTNVNVPSASLVPQLMDNISWRILEILKKNVNGHLTNSEYLDEINSCIYEMIRLQPFTDGNKRTARLVSNILYQEKGIPYVIVPIEDWANYVDAWSSENVDKYNELMHRLIIDSYKYFYGNQSMADAAKRIYGEKIILGNRVSKNRT